MITFAAQIKAPTINHSYGQRAGGRGKFLKPEAITYKRRIANACTYAMFERREKRITTDCFAALSFFFKSKRKRDGDNCVKLTLDAMQGIAYNNDCQVETHIVSRYYGHECDQVLVSVCPADSVITIHLDHDGMKVVTQK